MANHRNVEVTEQAHEALDDFIDRTGMKKKALVQKLIEWWARQDPVVRSLVIGDIPDGYEQIVAKMVLKGMAGLSPEPDPPGQPADPTGKPTAGEQAGRVVSDALETAAEQPKRAKPRRRRDGR